MKTTVKVAFVLLAIIGSAVSKFESETAYKILEKFYDSHPKELFKVYHTVFSKTYDLNTQEGLNKYKAFKDNLKYIKEENKKGNSYTVGLNVFADITNEEYRNTYLMDIQAFESQRESLFRGSSSFSKSDYVDFNAYDDSEIPPLKKEGTFNHDHTQHMTPVRHQKNCGACWAFATTASIEAAFSKCKKKVGHLSVQHLLDCDPTSFGCKGGYPKGGMEIAKNYIVTEKCHPYTEEQKACDEKKHEKCEKHKIHDYKFTRENHDEWIENVRQGPSAITINASARAMQLYTEGVVGTDKMECDCGPNHAVTLVAIDTDTKEIKVRNSWGETWGEKGHFRARVGKDNDNFSCWLTLNSHRPVINCP